MTRGGRRPSEVGRVRARRGRALRTLAGLGVLAVLLTACTARPGGSPSISGSGVPGPSARGPALQVLVVSTSIWAGDATVLVALEGADNRSFEVAGASLEATLTPLDAGGAAPVHASGRFVRPEPDGRGLYRIDVRLPSAGRWRLDASVAGAGAAAGAGSAEFAVRDPGVVVRVGDRAPRARTPIAADVGVDLRRLTSDPQPEPSFYWLSVTDALAAGRPFALVLDSFRFRESQACGGALGVMRHLAPRFPTLSIIHAEPFVTRFDGAALTLDPATGPARLAPWSEAWGLGGPGLGPASVPWIFVVRADGRVGAVFQGVVGSEELALALADVAAWTPSGG